MSRSLIVNLLIIAVLTLTVLCVACAPAAPAASKPAATPSTPAATPSAPATTPAATPAVTPAAPAVKPIETSFTPATFTNDAYGFSIMYPKKWAGEAVKDPVLLSVREGGQVPNLTVTIFNFATVEKEVADIWAAVPMTNIKYVTKGQEIVSHDGKNKGQYDIYTSDYPGGIKLRSFGASYQRGEKVVSFSITTMDGLEDEALYKEVFNTVTFK
jgi:hypothetical protein